MTIAQVAQSQRNILHIYICSIFYIYIFIFIYYSYSRFLTYWCKYSTAAVMVVQSSLYVKDKKNVLHIK